MENIFLTSFSSFCRGVFVFRPVPTACVPSTAVCDADIFWVFATPVMVSVAKNFDAPIKLLFPRALEPLGA